MPKEYPLEKGEEVPTTRRVIGASYQFNKIPTGQMGFNDYASNASGGNNKGGRIYNNGSNPLTTTLQQDLQQLNIEYDIQSKITNAAFFLASDPSAPKAIRKQRKDFYEKTNEKVIWK